MGGFLAVGSLWIRSLRGINWSCATQQTYHHMLACQTADASLASHYIKPASELFIYPPHPHTCEVES